MANVNHLLGGQSGRRMLSESKIRGVTLIEVAVGLVIISILFALAAPSFGGWILNQQIRTASESILNAVQLTRSESVKNNNQARLVLCGLPLSSWEILAVSAPIGIPLNPAPAASLACGAGSNAVAGEVRVQERSGLEGSRLALLAEVPVGATTVTFNGFGRVVANADGSPSITSISVTGGASAPATTRNLNLMIGASGNTRMCDPSPLLATSDPRHCP